MFVEVGLYEVFVVDTALAKELIYARCTSLNPENAIAQVSNKMFAEKGINWKHVRFFTRCIGTWKDTSPVQFTGGVVIQPPPKKEGEDEAS